MDTCYACGAKLQVIKDKPYHYTECGLEVLLYGVIQYACPECEETFTSIPNMQKLHRVIGAHICEQRKALLQPLEVKFLRKDLHLKAKDLAKALGVTPQTVSRWENGREQIGEAYDRLLRSIYMMYASEQANHAIGQGQLNFFTNLPQKRKKIKEQKEITLTPQEWMGEVADLCSAHA